MQPTLLKQAENKHQQQRYWGLVDDKVKNESPDNPAASIGYFSGNSKDESWEERGLPWWLSREGLKLCNPSSLPPLLPFHSCQPRISSTTNIGHVHTWGTLQPIVTLSLAFTFSWDSPRPSAHTSQSARTAWEACHQLSGSFVLESSSWVYFQRPRNVPSWIERSG